MPLSDKNLGYIVITFLLVFICGICAVSIWVVFVQPRIFAIQFKEIGNLKIEDAVVQKGLAIGHVKNIEWRPAGVLVTVETGRQPVFYTDYAISDIEKGLMGDRIIMMYCGDSTKPRLASTHILQGKFVPGISEAIGYIGKLHEIIKSLDSTALSLQNGHDGGRSPIAQFAAFVKSADTLTARLYGAASYLSKNAAGSIRSAGRAVTTIATAARPVMEQGPAQLRNADSGLDTLAVMTTRLEAFVDSARTLLASVNGRDSSEAALKKQALYNRLDAIAGTLDLIRSSGIVLRIGVTLR
ncbi:MAG: hypothetical protein PHC61_15260 [Chitinivibrionales bacterium]|nr:hypothetical protein [Chitinivibrionales bacterium]